MALLINIVMRALFAAIQIVLTFVFIAIIGTLYGMLKNFVRRLKNKKDNGPILDPVPSKAL